MEQRRRTIWLYVSLSSRAAINGARLRLAVWDMAGMVRHCVLGVVKFVGKVYGSGCEVFSCGGGGVRTLKAQ